MLLLSNGIIHTRADQGVIENGHILIDGERISAVGAGPAPTGFVPGPEDRVADLNGRTVTPGLIDAHCHIGLFNDGYDPGAEDGNEITDPVTPQLRAIDGVYHEDRCFAEALTHGVTTVLTGPGSANVLAGTFALLHTSGRDIDQMLIEPAVAMKAALGENPKRNYGHDNKAPATRMATAAILREALFKAREYADACNDEEIDDPEFNFKAEAMRPLLDGSLPLKIHAHRADDILTAIRIANEFGLTYTIEHCTEGYHVVEQLKEAYTAGLRPGSGLGQPGRGRLLGVIAGPLLIGRGKPELVHADLRNPLILAAAGIPLAIMSDHPENPVNHLPVYAALAVREGMPAATALGSITDQAAVLCGVGDRLGRLAPGYLADISVFSGDPLDTRSRAELVLIAGKTAWQRDTGLLQL
ncbi:MAG: amidohydrolase [Ruminococcaceae bacterium]|nr:amidohydrolase [Oscillospiraceae bacterium]